ncbi:MULTISPECIES: type VII toxin-antitoxin system HepT family RNase toxin [Psychrilyobacter]|uniref:DUF86 domain-containing protein n=1 Tax=Psychrilyobacter piezotolerans TaxID=2293438 RepID=A0ABX9KD65_9FUSO|nr:MULTISPECIES: DUF86 domain-containing protein [Psychrilyobacter]MCS5422938.1 DUF86 domain-containing protein [Psychrilyobacter sp. S5]NDI79160.1 DUF86 domain-containing protein [Psychrilyobacter piezotolerans]RDE58928.1 DUF86 domain-containing protein [Psychrilyobacter sp. S5]REI39479.1 DUF86 domain-containing protein [Psychrilyobacter piezotolerans]
MRDDIILNKSETIKRCIARINEEYDGNPENLNDYRRQDSIILNVQRLCEASIDIATHYIRKNKLGIPQTSKENFEILEKNNVITEELSSRLQGMVGFRNIAVHDYQALNLKIVEKVVEEYIYDSLKLARMILEK